MLNRIKSENAPAAIGSYSVGTEYQGILYLSGQLPIEPIVGEIKVNDIKRQTKQSMENIKAILESNNSNINHIIKTTVFLKDIQDFSSFDKIYKEYFTSNYPSRSAFEVANLPKNSLIEIEVIAAKKSDGGEKN